VFAPGFKTSGNENSSDSRAMPNFDDFPEKFSIFLNFEIGMW